MEYVVKKSLLAPVKTLKYCVTGEKKPSGRSKRGSKRHGSKGRACADPHLLRSYQADLERERKSREATNAQKNAERAAMRAHFRRKYQLTKNAKDADRLRAVGRKVSLPRELAKMVRPDGADKDDGFGLLRAFRGLSFGPAVFTGGERTRTAPAAGAEPCRVM